MAEPKHDEAMERLTVRVRQDQVEGIDQLVEDGHAHNRTVAVRDAIDLLLEEAGER